MSLKIVKYGDPVLRTKGAPVKEITDDLIAFAEEMVETMHTANGVGLAAQQVGVAIQMAVLDVTDDEERPSTMSIDGKPVDLEEWMPMAIINPQLKLGKEKESGTEGCLSFPDVTGEITRSAHVVATGTLIDGREIEFEATGLLARALQHEVDHLNGILFIDRMSSATKAGLAGKLKRLQGKK